MEFITKNKQESEDKLSILFSNSIISDVRREGDTYILERLTPDEFYKHSVESQKEMGDTYYNHLLSRLDVDLIEEAKLVNKKRAKKSK